jgi:hypothetical protein
MEEQNEKIPEPPLLERQNAYFLNNDGVVVPIEDVSVPSSPELLSLENDCKIEDVEKAIEFVESKARQTEREWLKQFPPITEKNRLRNQMQNYGMELINCLEFFLKEKDETKIEAICDGCVRLFGTMKKFQETVDEGDVAR